MYCGQCGTPNNEEAGHCETCGAPLLITTGARTCGNCGATLGDHDRFCTTCGSSASEAAASTSYDADDDFGELNIDDIQLDELPDWLQGMAPSAPPPQPSPQSSDQPSPDDLPDWLRDTPAASQRPYQSPPTTPGSGRSAPVQREQSGLDHQPADQFSLVSDEDLPDWLKALSDEDDSTPAPASTPPPPTPSRSREPQVTKAVANLYEVPPVSRAWLAQGRFVDQDQVSAARQEFTPLEVLSGVATGQAGAPGIWESGPSETLMNDEETRPFAVSQDESEDSGRGRMIVRVVILGLLVIVVLLLAFVLIQGV